MQFKSIDKNDVENINYKFHFKNPFEILLV